MATGNLKGYYKQKKSNTAISKSKKASSSSKSSTSKKSTPVHAATFGSDVTQPSALISHGSPDLDDDYDATEDILRQFDMNMAYGPCIGMSRLERWERANSFGMGPPEEIGVLLKSGKVGKECLWDGRV